MIAKTALFPPAVPKGYTRTKSGAIRRDGPRRIKMDHDSHHKATRRRARRQLRKA